MEIHPSPPIIVISNAGAEVDVFPSVQATLGYVEVFDVRDGEYEFYDVDGYPLHALTHEWTVAELHRVPGGHPDREALTQRLRQEVARIGIDRVGLPSIDTAELSELADALLALQTRFQAEHSLRPAALLRRLRRRMSGDTT